MASQLKNGTVQLNVLNEKLTQVRSLITAQNRINKTTSQAEYRPIKGTKLGFYERIKVVYECMNIEYDVHIMVSLETCIAILSTQKQVPPN